MSLSLKELFTNDFNVKFILENLAKLLPRLDTSTEEFFQTYNKIVSAVFNYESKRLKHLQPKDAISIINEITVKELHGYFTKQQQARQIEKELKLVISDKPIKIDLTGVSEITILNVFVYKHPYNITNDNNTFVIKVKDVEYFINIPEGQYSLESLVDAIQDGIFDVITGFRCYISPNTYKFNIESTDPFDIQETSTILRTLGFAGVHEDKTTYTSEFPMRLIHDDKIDYSIIFTSGLEVRDIKFPIFLRETSALQRHNVNYNKVFNPPIDIENIEILDSYNHYGFPQYLQIEIKYTST